MRRPRSRVVLVVLVAVLVVLAGCSLPGGGGQETTRDGTPSADARPPGVSDGKLTNASALLDAHVGALTETGFESDVTLNATLRGTVRGERQNQEVRRRQETIVEAGGRPYQYRLRNFNAGFQANVWGNASAEYARFQVANRSQYQTRQPASPANLAGRQLLARFLDTTAYEVTNVSQRGGRTLTTLEATGPPSNASRALTRGVESVQSYESTLVVDSKGRIYELTVNATYVIGGEEATFHFEHRLDRIGGVETRKPEWLSAF